MSESGHGQEVPISFFPVFSILLVLLTLVVGQVELDLYQEEINNGLRNKTKISSFPVFIVISFDGFRYDYFKKVNTPNFDAIRSDGVHTAYMKNQFPTKTFPNHHSVATGLHPESHGVIENDFFDPFLQSELDIKDEAFWKYRSDVIPIWILNEWAGDGRHSGTMMWPGSSSKFGYGINNTKPTYCTDFHTEDLDPFDSRVDEVISWITNDTHPANLVFMYLEEPDEHAHAFGPESVQVQRQIEHVDNVTGYLVTRLKELGIYEDVNLILLSDHGFQEVRQEHVINISALVDTSRFSKYGSTPTYLIEPNDGALEDVYLALETASQGRNFSVYRKETINATKPYWNFQNNPRIPPIILVADLGYAFDDYLGPKGKMKFFDHKFNVTHTPSRVYGIHGYDNHLMPMHPFFIAHGPEFRAGVEVEPFENIDIFPLLCHLMKIPTPPNNGTLPRTRDLLFKRGFNLGSHVGWAVAAAIIIGLFILSGIMSLMAVRQHNRRRQIPLIESNIGYRFVNGEASENNLEVVVNTGDGGAQQLQYKRSEETAGQEEHRALLNLSMSDSSDSENLI